MVKYIIENLKSKTSNEIASELLEKKEYTENVLAFYNFFGLQGGTIWILSVYIAEYKNGLKFLTV